LAFIKGLELHGKGWKKIANMIKTRTVVQIRTHAQKYFLKLSKARQNGEYQLANGAVRHGVDPARKRRPRRSDIPVAICPALKQYFQKDSRGPSPTASPGCFLGDDNVSVSTNNNSSIDFGESVLKVSKQGAAGDGNQQGAVASMKDELLDVETGLFNFLSPVLNGDDGSNTGTSDTNSVNSGDSTSSAPVYTSAPAWYAQGSHLTNLLQEAEGLDWSVDRGVSSVESSHSLKAPNPIYGQQNLITHDASLANRATVAANSDGPAVHTETAQPHKEGESTFRPWNLVQQQKKYLDEAATSVRGVGGASMDAISALTASTDSTGTKRTSYHMEGPDSVKRPKVELSAATIAQQQATASPSSVALAGNTDGKATVPVDPNLVEQMLSNQKLMQQQIDKLHGQLSISQSRAEEGPDATD
jgi:SHAQKYF class myb-like DNA-binding protein